MQPCPKSYTSSSSSSSPDLSSTPCDMTIRAITDTHQGDNMFSTQRTRAGMVSTMTAPALPAKSSLRASRLLASLTQKMAPEERPVLTPAAPHFLYLSSEEDVSSSADDFSDFDYDSDIAPSQKSPARRASHEDTARVVSVIFSGRPSIIELPRRSISPGSDPITGLLRTVTDPTLIRTRCCSSASYMFDNPPRSHSVTPSTFEKRRPPFLNIDPFATKLDKEKEEQEPQRTPKTPSGMFKRTFSLVRKRSKPALNAAAAQSRECLPAHPSPMEQMENYTMSQTVDSGPPTVQVPVTYQEIMEAARKKSARVATLAPEVDTISPLSSPPKKVRQGFSITRRRSVKV